MDLQHPTPYQVWRLGRGGRCVELLSSHAEYSAAQAAALVIRGARGICDVTRPLAGWLARWSVRHRGGDVGEVVTRRARVLEDCDRLRVAEPGTTPAELGLTRRRARRAAQALAWGHTGTRERWGTPVAPATQDVDLGYRRGRLVVRRGGVAVPDAEVARLIAAALALDGYHLRPASRRGLQRLLGWSADHVHEVLDRAEVLGWATVERGGVRVSPAGRRAAAGVTEHVAIAPLGGVA